MSYLMGQFFGMCRFEAEIAYDISVLEANSNVRCLKLYRITLRTSVLFVSNNEVKMSPQTTQ